MHDNKWPARVRASPAILYFELFVKNCFRDLFQLELGSYLAVDYSLMAMERSARAMGKFGFVLTGLCMASAPAFAQTAYLNSSVDWPPAIFRDTQSSPSAPLPFAELNQDRRLTESLPGAWQSDKQVLSAVETVRRLEGDQPDDGVMLYATSRRTIVSWKFGGGLDDASLSRMELTPGEASVGLAYRTGPATLALAYVNREYSQRIGAQTVSQTEDFAGLTLKLQLGQK